MKDKSLYNFAVLLSFVTIALICLISYNAIVSKKNEAILTLNNTNATEQQQEKTDDNFSDYDDIEITFVKNKDVKYNEMAEVLVLMYHALTPTDVEGDKIHRSVQGFKDDLQALYDNNYRVISMEDYINKDIHLEAGYSPVLITFDDGLQTAFSFENINGQLVPKKDTAVDIMNKFYKKHEDFGKSATFFVYNKNEMFMGFGTLMDKFNYLIYNDYDIGNHSYSHKDFASLDEQGIIEELGKNHNVVYDNSEYYSMKAIAYPYGNTPKDEYLQTIFSIDTDEYKYNYDVAFLAFLLDEYSSNPYSTKFDPYKIPRTRGTDNEPFDLGYFLDYYEKNPSQKYISDGLDNVISVPYDKFEELDFEYVKEKDLSINVIDTK